MKSKIRARTIIVKIRYWSSGIIYHLYENILGVIIRFTGRSSFKLIFWDIDIYGGASVFFGTRGG